MARQQGKVHVWDIRAATYSPVPEALLCPVSRLVQVDVWSAGVIFYQMLFGRRPFGEGCSQEQIMRERVVLNARQVREARQPVVLRLQAWATAGSMCLQVWCTGTCAWRRHHLHPCQRDCTSPTPLRSA